MSGGPLRVAWERLRTALRQPSPVRPTREGGVGLLVLLGVIGAAVNTGNNLLYVVLACLLAIALVSNFLAEWNLRNLQLSRVLPLEAYAGIPALGHVRVENRRRWGRALTLVVRDHLADGTLVGEGRVLVVEPGGLAEVPLRYTFPERGQAPLGMIEVESRFPFGLARRFRRRMQAERLLVWPRPLAGPPADPAPRAGFLRADPRQRGGSGDLSGLREYERGDRLRDLHWPTTARVGRPVVVVREAEAAPEVRITVPPVHGEALETALGRAAGQVDRHMEWGHAVGLEVGDQQLPARTGEAWRRALLDALAAVPGGSNR